MILRSGRSVIDSTNIAFTYTTQKHYIITLPESKCVCSVRLGSSQWKDGINCHDDPYKIYVSLKPNQEEPNLTKSEPKSSLNLKYGSTNKWRLYPA